MDGAVNAMVTRCFERAREEAKTAEEAVSRGDELGVLHGLPMGVKDLNVTEGVLTTYSSPSTLGTSRRKTSGSSLRYAGLAPL